MGKKNEEIEDVISNKENKTPTIVYGQRMMCMGFFQLKLMRDEIQPLEKIKTNEI